MGSEPTDFVASVYAHAADLLQRGLSPDDVRLKLQVDLNLPKETADMVVSKLESMRAAARREAGREMMLGGALVCAVGVIITWVSYANAAPGGTYIIAWGAIVFGAWRFVKGLHYSQG